MCGVALSNIIYFLQTYFIGKLLNRQLDTSQYICPILAKLFVEIRFK